MAIVEFYIKNFVANGSVIENWTLMQTIPIVGEPVITEPKVKNELGKAGSFEFGMELGTPYYDSLIQMKTLLQVKYFGKSIFRGRVLTIDRTMARTRSVHCEGDFAFFMDTPQPGTKEETRPQIGVLAYLTQILNQHNAMVYDNDKKIYIGEVPDHYGSYVADSQKVAIPAEKAIQQFGDTSWNTTMDRLENLLSDFGGYFRTRVGSNGVTYLDWYDRYYNATLNTQTIEITKNLIDITGSTEVENLFTAVIPLGKNSKGKELSIADYWPVVSLHHERVNYITVPELATVPLYSDAELNADYHRKEDYLNAISRYGWIWKTVSFENANSPEKLFAYAKDWIKNNYNPELTQWSVSALDMKLVDDQNEPLYCGDRVNVRHPEVEQIYSGMTIITAEYDLYNPDKNQYTIGIPNQQVNASYGVKQKTGSGKGGASSSKPSDNQPNDADKQLAALRDQMQMDYIKKSHGEDVGYDDPFAFMKYNTDGTERETSEVLKDAGAMGLELMQVLHDHLDEITAEAARRGWMPNDPRLLIEFSDKYSREQSQWKTAFSSFIVNTLNLDLEYAEVLTNDGPLNSWLAHMVDDNGNWTPAAYEKGLPLSPNADKIKRFAKDTRRILSGQGLSNQAQAINNVSTYGSFGAFNVGGFLNVDLSNPEKAFSLVTEPGGVDELLSAGTAAMGGTVKKAVDFIGGAAGKVEEIKTTATQAVTTGVSFLQDALTARTTKNAQGQTTEKKVDINADNLKADSTNGTMNVGKVPNSNDWWIKLNDTGTQTYWDPASEQEVTRQTRGFVKASDFGIVSEDNKFTSLYSKLLIVDTLLVDYAQINTLVAMNAAIGDLNARTVTAETITSKFSIVEGSLSTDGAIIANQFYLKNRTVTTPLGTAFVGMRRNPDHMEQVEFLLANGSYSSSYQLPNSLVEPHLTLAGNSYELTFTTASGDETEPLTFSRAISSSSWSWVNGAARVTLQPQNQTFYSNSLDIIQPHGQVTWDADNKGFTVTLDVDDSDGTTAFSDTLHFNTTTSYNAGSVTTLSGGWNGNTGMDDYVVTATPQGETYTVPLSLRMVPNSNTTPRDAYFRAEIFSEDSGQTYAHRNVSGRVAVRSDTVNNKQYASVYYGTVTTPIAEVDITGSGGAVTLNGGWATPSQGATSVTATIQAEQAGQAISGVMWTSTVNVAVSKQYCTLTDENGSQLLQVDNPQYGNGWRTAAGKVSWPTQNESTSSAYFSAPTSTVDQNPTPKQYFMQTVGADSTAYVKLVAPDDTTVAKLPVGTLYTDGFNTGNANRASKVQDVATSSNSYNKQLLLYSQNYEIQTQYQKADGTWANGGTYVIQTPENRYGAGRTNGWASAFGEVDLPTSQSSAESFSIHTPKSTLDGGYDEETYTLSSATNNIAVVKNKAGTVVARLEHNKYNAGNANRASDVGSVVTTSDSADQQLSAYNQKYKVQTRYQNADGTWSNGGGYVIQTPSDRYDTGYAAAKGSYTKSGGVLTVSKSTTGSAFPISFSIDAGISYDSSTHKYTATASCDDDQMDSIEGGTEAYTDGRNSVGIANISSSDITGSSSSDSGTVTIRTDVSGGGSKQFATTIGHNGWQGHNITIAATLGGQQILSKTISADTIYNLAIAELTKVTCDASLNHNGDWFNCRLYKGGTQMRMMPTNGSSVGLYIPLKRDEPITANGTYGRPDGYVGYESFTVNVPTSSASYTFQISTGSAPTSQMSYVLSGYNPRHLTFSAQQSGYSRYIKITVDGGRALRSYYWE